MGEKALFWNSSWLDGQAPAILFPLLYKHSKRKNRTVSAAMTGNRWVKDICYNLTPDLLTKFFVLWERIEAQQLTLDGNEEDQLTWKSTASGLYSTNSAYDFQLEGHTRSPVAFNTWKPWGPSKCKFFVWLLLQNRIWTADGLLLREWPNCYFCPLCERNLETAFHLVAECPFSKQVWLAAAAWANCQSLSPACWTNTQDLQPWFCQFFAAQNQLNKGMGSLVLLIICSLWKECNNRIFRKQELTISRFISNLRDDVRLWIFAGAKSLDYLVRHIFRE
jgi:hypothetical protein